MSRLKRKKSGAAARLRNLPPSTKNRSYLLLTLICNSTATVPLKTRLVAAFAYARNVLYRTLRRNQSIALFLKTSYIHFRRCHNGTSSALRLFRGDSPTCSGTRGALPDRGPRLCPNGQSDQSVRGRPPTMSTKRAIPAPAIIHPPCNDSGSKNRRVAS